MKRERKAAARELSGCANYQTGDFCEEAAEEILRARERAAMERLLRAQGYTQDPSGLWMPSARSSMPPALEPEHLDALLDEP